MNTSKLFIAMIAIGLSQVTFAQNAAPVAAVAPAPANPKTTNPVDPVIIAELKGEWKNELGSILKIDAIDAASGLISGTYKSPSGTAGDEYPLTGWVNTAAPADPKLNHVVVVSFSVRWGALGSVTAWNGYYALVGSDAKIVGQWFLSRPNTNFAWDHILTGQDRFTK